MNDAARDPALLLDFLMTPKQHSNIALKVLFIITRFDVSSKYTNNVVDKVVTK